jgi:hypothetical protein
MQRHLRLILSTLLVVLLIPVVASADNRPTSLSSSLQQTAGEVTYDTPVEGEITNATFN